MRHHPALVESSRLAQWSLMRRLRCATAAVVQLRGVAGALQDGEHAADRRLVGTNQLAVALVGLTTMFQQPFKFVCLGEDFVAA